MKRAQNQIQRQVLSHSRQRVTAEVENAAQLTKKACLTPLQRSNSLARSMLPASGTRQFQTRDRYSSGTVL